MFALGVIMLVAGIICVAVPGVNFIAVRRIANIGYVHVDPSKPHTIFLNPVVGGALLATGLILMLLAR